MPPHPPGLLQHPEGWTGRGEGCRGPWPLVPPPRARTHLEGAGEKQEEGEEQHQAGGSAQRGRGGPAGPATLTSARRDGG